MAVGLWESSFFLPSFRGEAIDRQSCQNVAYDVEDILDEFSTEALERNLMAEHQASTSKVRNLIPACYSNLTPRAALRLEIHLSPTWQF
ncbi:hypothetical protein Dsin_013759 [Dipteronia sinensis]|uniref:Uncharacterized protein n=1 Tax=Dipteronia sinensis TaxID=43782 RepID=A0AAE0E9E6_9ROSI|nr:hypothetical protein Dsin_013759 [Dipteronia sinensis]